MPSIANIPRICAYCSMTFLAKTGNVNTGGAKYCSRSCAGKALEKRVSATCEQCGKPFITYAAWLRRGGGRYCSSSCFGKTRTGHLNPAWQGGNIQLICKQCGGSFVRSRTESDTRQFCSIACAQENSRHRGNNHVSCQCEQCGTIFLAKPTRVARGDAHYCSHRCRIAAWDTRETRLCVTCGNTFMIYASKVQRCCSNECAGKYRGVTFRGERSPFWKGGAAFGRVAAAELPKYQTWRLAVFGQDRYTCQDCGEKGGKLNAHHLQPWKSFPALRFIPENGVTLCVTCHRQRHKQMRLRPKDGTNPQTAHP